MKKEQIIFDFKEAEKEHKRMFPLATPETQLRKLNEEWSEHATAASIEEAYEEYGDFLFVCISLRRFVETLIVAEALLDKYYFSYPVEEQKIFMKYLQEAVNKVRIRIEKKEYNYKDGSYDRERLK